MNIAMILVDCHKVSDTLDQGVRLEKVKYFLFQTPVINSLIMLIILGICCFCFFIYK